MLAAGVAAEAEAETIGGPAGLRVDCLSGTGCRCMKGIACAMLELAGDMTGRLSACSG